LTLLAIPNFSEGRDAAVIDAIGSAIVAAGDGARLLDVHIDPDHNRSVFTVAGAGPELVAAIVAAARAVLAHVDLRMNDGLHPHVGVLDVAPIVYRAEAQRGGAIASALVLADTLGLELRIPVFLYGELGGGRTRASLRRGGTAELMRRVEAGELRPDFGPSRIDPAAGATLVGARPPLIAFNAELAPTANVEQAQRIAAAIRESGSDGLPGVRAIGLWLDDRGVAQVSINIEDYERASPAAVVAAIERHAPIAECELVGLAPRAAFADFPTERLAVRNLRYLETSLRS
jgi:glutamate formiminotransferase/glutamate formiminotransferase/formiminotetrahydrofolate cyclodeaminase